MDYCGTLNKQNKHIKSLIDSIVNEGRRLIIFAGAGISVFAGLPLWKNFANNLANDCFNDGLISFKEKEEYLKISDPKKLITLINYIYESKHKKKLFNKHFIDNLTYDDNNVNKKAIVNALKKLNASIITTNADTVLDDCAKKQNKVLYGNAISNYIKEKNSNEPYVIHIHGSIKKMDTLVFTIKDYLKLYSDKENVLNKLMINVMKEQNNCILFIGTSMNEMELLQYFICDGVASKFILNGFYNHQKKNAKIEEQYLKDCFDITQISYSMDKKGYKAIVDFLTDLSNELPLLNGSEIKEFESINNTIKSGNVNNIIDEIIHNVDVISFDLLSLLFKELNNYSFAHIVYERLYEHKKDYFDIKKLDFNNQSIQNIVYNNIINCDFNNSGKSIEFINDIISSLFDYITNNFSSTSNINLYVNILIKLIIKNIKNNEKYLIAIIKKYSMQNLEFLETIIYWIRDCDLTSKIVFEIFTVFIKNDCIQNNTDEIYIFINNDIKKILSCCAIDAFLIVKDKINEIVKLDKTAYCDMGAIYDYDSEKNYLSKEIYYIKLIKTIINNMEQSVVFDSYEKCISSNVIDEKIKLYIIDKHFAYMKEKLLDKNVLDSIDLFPSVCWIVEHHKSSFQADTKFKENFIKKINGCTFKQDDKKDSDGLKYIIKDLLNNRKYSENIKNESHYKYYEFKNIGKHFWVSNVNEYSENSFNKLSTKSVEDVIFELNNNCNNYSFFGDSLSEYFNLQGKIDYIMNNPNLFISIRIEKYYRNVLSPLLKENNIDKLIIKKFINSVFKEKYSNNTASMWIDILIVNKLVDDYEFSIPILNTIFENCVNNDYKFDVIKEDAVIITINNIIFRCVVELCNSHIKKNDILDFVSSLIEKYHENPNYLFIVSALSSSYEIIREQYASIDEIVETRILSESTEEIISFFNCLVLGGTKYAYKFINTKMFINIYKNIDDIMKTNYLNYIFANYDVFTDEMLDFAVKLVEEVRIHEIIGYLIESNLDYKKMLNLLNKIQKNKVASVCPVCEILKLFIRNSKDKTVRHLCKKYAAQKYKSISLSKFEKVLMKSITLDETFVVKFVVVPIVNTYFTINELYYEDKMIEIFDELFKLCKNNDSRVELVKLSNFAASKGNLKFGKFKDTLVTVK